MTLAKKLRCNAQAAAIAAAALLAFSAADALAVSGRVKVACASDYFAFCSMHKVGTPAVRGCMRAAGPKLSKRCVNALIREGEVSDAEVARRAARLDD